MPDKDKDKDKDQVRLKPFMNIRPGVYLACIYGAILLVILFFILLRPGILNPGSVLIAHSEPWGAAVLVDGVYMGTAPGSFFVPRGQRRIEMRLPGFTPQEIEKEIRGRFFASRFFPRRVEIRKTLKAPDPALAFLTEAADYTAWTFIGEPSAAHQIPLTLSEAAYRFGPAASDPALRELMEDTITAAARFAVTRASLRDLIRAKTLADNHGLSPSPLSLLGSAGDALSFLDNNPEAALWLASVLTADAQAAVTASSWHAQAAGAQGTAPPVQAMGAQTLQLGQLNFRLVEGGSLAGRNFPAGTTVETFYISETVISVLAWELFLQQQPRWRRENTAALVREGLVREGHLEAISFPGTPAQGVSGISWYAARAFCQWLTAFLPPQYAAWEVRLPTEAEWEHAAKAGLPNTGLFWEWCEDPFVPLSFISAPSAAVTALGSPERPLRGGSWINPTGVGNETRGSLPPYFSSPFVSFRPVIAPRGNQP